MGKRAPIASPAGKTAKAPAAGREWPLPLLYAAAIILCIGLYWRTADFKLTGLDDTVLISCFSGHRYQVTDAFTTNVLMEHNAQDFYRPMQSLSFMVDAALTKSSPAGWYRSNLAVHCLTVCCVLYLLLLLGFDRRLSFATALTFAAGPLFANAVAWIPGRGDLLIGLFGTLAFIGVEKFRQGGKPAFLTLQGIAFLLAIFSKESAIALPVVFGAYLTIRDRKRVMSVRNLSLAASWFAMVAFFLFVRHAAMGDLPAGAVFGMAPLLANLQVLPETIAALFACFDIPVLPGFTLWRTTIGLLVIAGLALSLAKQKKLGKPAVLLGAFWFVLLSLPGMMFRHEFGSHAYDYLNHRSYLPMIGVFILLAEAVPASWYRKDRRRFAALCGALVGVLCILAWRQSGFFADQASFYGEAIRTNPASALAHYNRGTFLCDSGDLQGALRDFDQALSLYPDYAAAYVNRSNARATRGDIPGAIADAKRGVELNPHNAIAISNLAQWKEAAHDTDGALADLNRALQADPTSATARNNRGIIFLQRSDYRRAAADFDVAIQAQLDFPVALANRAICRISIKDTAGALGDFSQAIALDPAFENAYNNRGLIFLERHDYDRAEADFQAAIRSNPHSAEALANFARSRMQRGDQAGACAAWQEAIRLGSTDAERLHAYFCR